MQTPAPILTAERFPALLDALLDLLNGLSLAEWAIPTAAAGWTVHDVALHLLGGDLGILSGQRDGYREPNQGLAGWQELVDWLNRRNGDWVRSTRRISPHLLCDLLRFSGDQVSAYFDSLDPFAAGGVVSWAGPQPAPLWLDIAREFTERWHHQQHIRDALGKPGATGPDFLAPVLSAFVFALPRTYQPVEAQEGACLTLTIRGESGGSWTVRREAGAWQLYRGRPALPQAEVSLPEDAAWRLFTKGLSPAAARSQAELSGDLVLAEKAFETIAIIA
jgi:uncharacterized protein (TIGR03083 family)